PPVLPRAAVSGAAAPAVEPARAEADGGALAGVPAQAAPPAPVRESPEVAAAWSLRDDGARAGYLSALVKQRPDSGVYVEIARAAARMTSPSAQRDVLAAVVTCPEVGRAGVVAALESVASVRSSSDQRHVLAQVAGGGWMRDASVRRAFFRSLDTVSGSSDRRDLLRLVLERGHTDPESLASVISAAGRLGTSSDVRDVLAPAAATGRVTGGLRDLYLRTASAVPTESDRAYAITALLGGGQERPRSGAEARGRAGRLPLPSDTPDADGWITRMSLSDGKLVYDDERDGARWQLLVEGKDFLVQVNGSTSRVVVRPGGRVVLGETGPATRSLEIRADARGRETRTFHVDGRPRPYDAQAEAWTAAFLDRLHVHLTRPTRSSGGASRSPEPARSPAREVQGWDATLEIEGQHDDEPSHRATIRARDLHLRGTELVGILPGGSLLVEETIYPAFPDPDPLKPRRGSTTRRLEAQRAAGGEIQWHYRVDGVERPFGDEGRAWLARILRKYASTQ
ncbi:MAG TPA: hypothetical protein VHG51_01700, partial [Longimicrobiaceae bacterium]|nr:hypothetical protein [Longimicrobiaceae bacterium]